MAIEFKRKTLSNGMEILAEVDPRAASAAAGFFVKTGARDETGDVMGVSHYLEHMMFKGTERLTADEINQGFDDLGARNNAYTSNEMTCFYAHVLPEKMDESVGLLAEMMRPALRQDDFDTEKGVILEEIAMYKDNPFWVLYEETLDRHYRPHPMSHRVLGTDETIKALTRDQMMGYFERRYSADNTVVSLAGNLDFEAICGQIERATGGWQVSKPGRDAHRPSVGTDRFAMTDDSVARGYYLAVAQGPSVQDDRRYAATLAAQTLGASDNSRLHWALIEEGIAEEAQAAFDAHDGCGEFFVYASGEPGRLAQIEEIIDRECAGLAASVTVDDLDRLRARMLTGATVGGERPADRMQRLGRQWTTRGEYTPLEEELDRIAAVTVTDVREVLAAFPLARAMRGVLKPA